MVVFQEEEVSFLSHELLSQADRLNQEAWSLRYTDATKARTLAKEAERLSADDPRVLAESTLTLAFCESAVGAYDTALRRAQAAYAYFHEAGDSVKQAHADVLLGLIHTRLGAYDEALSHHRQSLDRFRRARNAEGEGLALMYTGGVYLDRGESRRALDSLQKALALFRMHSQEAHQAQVLLMLGVAYEALGDYACAYRCDLEALEQARAAGNLRQEATLLNNLGTHYRDAGDNAQALEYYLKALELTEQVSNPNLGIKLLSNVGEVQLDIGEPLTALRSFEEALRLSRVLGQRRDEGAALETLGEVHSKLGNADRTRLYLEQALEVRKAIGDRRGEAHSLGKFATFYVREGLPQEAQTHFEEALACAREVEDRFVQANALLGLGRLAAEQDKPDAAREHLRGALELADDLGLKRQLSEVHLALSESYEAGWDTGRALEHFKQHHALVRQLTDERVAKHTRHLTLQLELEHARKDAEIERLRSVELARANAALEARDQENARLVSELRDLAHKDALTGLPNRRSFTETLASSFIQASRYGRPLSVALADIDDFKRINDRFSHAVGDEVLRVVAGILMSAIREGDVVARIGGEEFAFIFPEAARDEGLAVCERVRQAVAGYDWERVHPSLQVNVSVGLSHDTGVGNFERMLAQADARLYEAKRAGKNKAC